MREEVIGFTEEEEIDWRLYLRDFREMIYPLWAEHGFTLPEAFAAWRQEIYLYELKQIRAALEDPDNGWKG